MRQVGCLTATQSEFLVTVHDVEAGWLFNRDQSEFLVTVHDVEAGWLFNRDPERILRVKSLPTIDHFPAKFAAASDSRERLNFLERKVLERGHWLDAQTNDYGIDATLFHHNLSGEIEWKQYK